MPWRSTWLLSLVCIIAVQSQFICQIDEDIVHATKLVLEMTCCVEWDQGCSGGRTWCSTVPDNIFELEQHSGKYCLSWGER